MSSKNTYQTKSVDNTSKSKYNRNIVKEGEDFYMIAKIWKKLCLVILIVACLFNIVNKLVSKNPLSKELQTSATYLQEQQNKK